MSLSGVGDATFVAIRVPPSKVNSARSRLIYLAIAATGAFSIAACGVPVDGTPTNSPFASTGEREPRQADDNGVNLPFKNHFPSRWNDSNNGTPYEPCTSLSAAELRKLKIDPGTVHDAADVNGQTLRGCAWSYSGQEQEDWGISQTVGNYDSLASYKGTVTSVYTLHPDLIIGNRTVGVISDPSGGCSTYVQSRGAGVITGAQSLEFPLPPRSIVCARALELTKATLAKVPE